MTSNNPSEASTPELRLSCFEVTKLYNEFSYKIPLNIERHVTAVIAPNGSGKTICLRLIDGLFNSNWSIFETIDFNKCIFTFSDDSIITIARGIIQESLLQEEAYFSIEVILYRPGKKKIVFNPSAVQFNPLDIEKYVPYITRVSPTSWVDERSGRMYGKSELGRLWRDYSQTRAPRSRHNGDSAEIIEFLSGIKCKLIETQRLLVLGDIDEERYGVHNRRRPSMFAISQKAEALRKIISDHINKYAVLSQSLDRSFPRRVIRPQENSDAEEIADVERELSALDARRQELTEVGILDVETDAGMGLPRGKMQDAVAQVLRVYIKDNKEKLSSLDEIFNKISLFKSLLAARFGQKRIEINKGRGLSVLFGDREVPIEALSSGEQHQLVLFFELLFQTPRNSLILIDEPEISLHIAWQKKFINDLMSIIKLNHFDVVLATHSPQLIGRWQDIVVELGDVYENESGDL